MSETVVGTAAAPRATSGRPWSLRHRLGLALGALALAVALGLSLALASYAGRELLQVESSGVEVLGRQVARELSTGMDRFAREIQLQTLNPVLADPSATPERMRAALEAIQRVYPEFAHVAVVDVETTRLLAATGGIFEGGSARGRPVFEQAKETLFVGDVHDAVRLASLLPRPANGEPLRFLDVGAPVPVPGGGPARRVVAAHLGWEWTRQVRDRALKPVEDHRRAQILLVDTAGAVVLPPDTSIKVGTPLSALLDEGTGRTRRWSDGRDYLTADALTFATGSFPGLGWRVVVRQPLDEALAVAERLRTLFLLGGLVLGSLGAAVGWALAGRLARPMSELARAASQLTVGKNLAPAAERGSSEPEEVAAVRGAFHRVTGEALERAERLLRELTAVYEGAPVGLCVFDRELRYVRVNKVWAEAFGAAHPVAGPAQEALFADAPAGLVAAARQALEDGEPREVEVKTGSGPQLRFWQAVIAPLRTADGSPAGASAVATDVTDIRRAEQALRLADQRKNEFVAMLAHELRNPLSPISNALWVLERDPAPEQALRMRQMIRTQLRHLVRLIDDLLEISRITLNKISMKFERLPTFDVCEAAVAAARHLADAKAQRIELTCAGTGEIWGDRERMAQIVGNLLGNAIKYSPEGALVKVSATEHEGMAVIAVEDSGRGIDAEFLPRVFDLFAQAPTSLDRSEGGLGVGLAMVKGLAELHGGRATAFSEGPGRGSRFEVWIPLAAAHQRGSEPGPVELSSTGVGAK